MHKYNVNYQNLLLGVEKLGVPAPKDLDGLWTDVQKEQLLRRFIHTLRGTHFLGGWRMDENQERALKMYYGLGEERLTAAETAERLKLKNADALYRMLKKARKSLVADMRDDMVQYRTFMRLFSDPEVVTETKQRLGRSSDRRKILDYSVYTELHAIQRAVLRETAEAA